MFINVNIVSISCLRIYVLGVIKHLCCLYTRSHFSNIFSTWFSANISFW